MKLNRHKFYTAGACDEHGHSLGIAFTSKGFRNLNQLFALLKAKNNAYKIEYFHVYDLWDRHEEYYHTTVSDKTGKRHFRKILKPQIV